ncbi:MAG: hypothetical protein QOE33_3390 [Acidobacteriota bacterium]|nr:hypothetical protein [Acidobacteriota bacterium]
MNQRHNSTALILRWSARATSLLAVALLLFFLFGTGMARPAPKEWAGLLFFPVGVATGLALAWRREALGVAVSVLSLAAFYLIYGALLGGGVNSAWFVVFTSPAALFFASWLAHRSVGENDKRAATV